MEIRTHFYNAAFQVMNLASVYRAKAKVSVATPGIHMWLVVRCSFPWWFGALHSISLRRAPAVCKLRHGNLWAQQKDPIIFQYLFFPMFRIHVRPFVKKMGFFSNL